MLEKNQTVSLAITDLTAEGNGVGRVDGMAVFVPNTAPGDQIQAKIVKVKSSYAYGILEELVEPSPDRVENDCPVYPRCGGCTLRHLSYQAELTAKEGWLTENMRRIGGIQLPWEPIIPSPVVERYRNKAQYPIRLVNGQVKAGFFAPRSHRLIPMEDCKLQPELFSQICGMICAFAQEQGIPPYDEEAHSGLLRHLLIRQGETSGQVSVCLVLNGKSLPGEEALADRLEALHPGVSLSINVNTRQTNVILGSEIRVVRGDRQIEDTLCGVPLRLSPTSFFQVNRPAAELLYQTALEYAAPAGETVLDLYCGIGSIGLAMAGEAKEIIGVETVEEAVSDARQNAKRAGIENARFLHADAGEAATLLRQEGLKPGVVVVDPPRKGVAREALETIAALEPKRIVYVSCNSATLARDCALLEEMGYEAVRGRPVDLFPRTGHVESVVLLSKLNTKHHIEIDLNLDEMDLTSAESKATYEEIKAHVFETTGLKVSSLYVAQVKRKYGIIERTNYNIAKSENSKRLQCPPEKEAAITSALKHFEMI